MSRAKLSPPWCEHYRKIQAMFRYDPDVHVIFDEDNRDIKIYVEGTDKAYAIDQIIIHEVSFGRIKLNISVVPSNDGADPDADNDEDIFERALGNNDALAFVKVIHGVYPTDFKYVVFTKKVVQYFNDDLSDLNGFRSTLYEDIAKDIFNHDEFVFFCTDVTDID